MKADNRCFSCLRKFHVTKACKNKRKCPQCAKFHHISICSQQKDSVKSDVLENKENPTMSLYLQSNKTVILPSAKAIVCSKNGKEVYVRLLLDQCSTRTFIRKDLCEELELTGSFENELLHLNTFGSSNISSQSSGRVEFTIKKTDNSEEVPLCANVVDTICSPQPSYKVSGFSQFAGLGLADEYDPRDKDLPVSILVGADFYYNIVTDSVLRGNTGPVAISSKLGWLASGILTCPLEEQCDKILRVQCMPAPSRQDYLKLKSFGR